MLTKVTAAAALVAILVGVAGLLTPVRVSLGATTVSCGTAVAPDLDEARTHDDGTTANIPVGDVVLVDASFTELCRRDLADRRIWTSTVAIAGVLALVSAVAIGRRRTRATVPRV
ncbi:hypothetical protein E4P42_21580 [Mycobacterium sp. PS03-16]|uniref:hypothetical protein n=1 Tax=Mycobacterium sp. PS03-16 TaxID=2559611 RepID=UPI0010736F25|nr:hypothetical protein [Mycobacterium sp. PS03-16]TFV55817.1 hypothetical protein E4P42_21580 [Mycobacterium sp. PS03-16]